MCYEVVGIILAVKVNACGGNSLSSLETQKDGEYYHPHGDVCICTLVVPGLNFISILFSSERPREDFLGLWSAYYIVSLL